MHSRWSDAEASRYLDQYGPQWGEDLALRTYTSRLLGADDSLVLHGGGNTSVKGEHTNVLGQKIAAVYVKASGQDMAAIEPAGHSGLDLEYLRKLRSVPQLTDAAMVEEFRTHFLDSHSATPSIETLAHAFLPPKYIDHTHADAILVLTNQPEGERLVREALGEDVIFLEYVRPGFKLAHRAATAFDAQPKARAMVWMRHGLVTWGTNARESYESMIEMVSRAEAYLAQHARHPLVVQMRTPTAQAQARFIQIAPRVRGLLAQPTGEQDRLYRRVILHALTTEDVLNFVDSDRGKEFALAPALTADHLVRTKPWPLWIDQPAFDDAGKLREQLAQSIQGYTAEYNAYLERHAAERPPGVAAFDPLPRVILMPGLGALCAGKDARAARIAGDITAHTLRAKAQVAAMGTYEGLSEDHLFDMEYFTLQHAKLRRDEPPLDGEVAVITGAAGAIGSGIAEGLLEQGCHVAVTDLPGPPLTQLASELRARFGERVAKVPLDVTDPGSVDQAFEAIIATWGGVDLVIVNAGVAMVSALETMDLERFRKVERVNTEGTLLTLSAATRHFKSQGTGGDIVLVSTKNVFAPGAKFGAYSATKAAAHQLARIASLELAQGDVRVNMVAPDAVFSHGARKSGLWAEVGPDRMRARGLDEKGLEEYYRSRNLLKAAVTARHVARAVLFFATRQTPTTGATLPVDGGLPDATPR